MRLSLLFSHRRRASVWALSGAVALATLSCGEGPNKYPYNSGTGGTYVAGSAGLGSGGTHSAGQAGSGFGGTGFAGSGAMFTGGTSPTGGAGGEGPSGCPGASPVDCADGVESEILQRWSVTSGADPSALSTIPGVRGTMALRLNAPQGDVVTLSYAPSMPVDVSQNDELRLLARGKDNSPNGWQGAWVVISDGTNDVKYQATTVPFSKDGETWVELRVPVAGGHGWSIIEGSADALDRSNIQRIDVIADTWDVGFVLDLDGIGFEQTDTVCSVSCPSKCSGRGECDTASLGCVCEFGATGAGCEMCRDGFELRSGHCELKTDGKYDYWPNAVSSANGDAWVGSSRVDLQACKLEYSIVSPK